jgi:hypothetical protein
VIAVPTIIENVNACKIFESYVEEIIENENWETAKVNKTMEHAQIYILSLGSNN